jgi:hypothetical protein
MQVYRQSVTALITKYSKGIKSRKLKKRYNSKMLESILGMATAVEIKPARFRKPSRFFKLKING